MMKNYHIATRLFTVLMLSTVLPLCSCEQQETPLSDGEDMLSINATLDGELDVNTRSYSGDVSLVDKGFTIAGYLLKGQYAPETMTIAPNVFDKSTGYQAVSKLSATNAKFKIPLPLIGLGTEDEPTYLSVLAWTQGDTDTGYGITGQTGNSSVGMPYLNINLQSPDKRQGDIAAAQKIDHLNDYVITAIDLDFKHILSKMSFVVKNSTGTGISVKDVKLAVAENALYSKAKYTFNGSDSIGIYSDYNTYYPKKEYTPTGWATTPTLTDAGTATLGELLLIPQKALAGFITVKVTYTVNGDAMNTPITRTLPLKANDLRSGKNYIYTLDVNADAINVINVSVGGWKEAPTNALPMVPGECGDVVLLLEGKDEPYQHTDGKLYWLDRSGYNNHCEIVNSSDPISWNNQDGYTFPGTGSYAKVPDLGQFNGDMLCELVCSLNRSYTYSYPTPITFQPNNNRAMLACIAQDKKDLLFDYGRTPQLGYQRVITPRTNVNVDWDKRAFYAFNRNKNGYMSVMRNKSIYQESQSVSGNNIALLNEGIIGREWNGEINYVKIVKNKKTVAEVEEDYKTLTDSYKFKDNLSKSKYLPPVQTGLVYCMTMNSHDMSDQTIYNVAYNRLYKDTFWGDQYPGPHSSLRIPGDAVVGYSSPVTIMDSQSFTLEIVAINTGSNNTIISFHPDQSSSSENNRQIQVHLPWTDAMAFNSPMSVHRLQIDNINTNQWHKYNFIRNPLKYSTNTNVDYQFMEIWQDGIRNRQTYWLNNPTSYITTLQPIKYFTIGGQWFDSGNPSQFFTGHIYAIRLYNRVLTEEEIKKNYQYDKDTFRF